MKSFVLVKGNIIGMAGCHVARNFVCLVPDFYENSAMSIIEGDLILDEHSHILPYCIYAATGGVSTVGNNILQITPQPSNVFSLFKQEINKIQELLQVPIPQHLKNDLNRLLYINVVGALEFFITELLGSFVMGDKDYFDAFIEKSQVRIPLSKLIESASDIPQTIHKAIHEFNAHDLRKMNNLYKAVLNISFPDYGELSSKIKTRHDLVHRNGYEVKDRTLKYIEITPNMIIELISICNVFTEQLMNNLQNLTEKWNRDIEIGVTT